MQQPVTGTRPGALAGQENLTLSGGLVHSGPGGRPVPARDADVLAFVRLRIYYEVGESAGSGSGHAQPGHLQRMVIARDSRRFVVPGLPAITDETRLADYIASQLARGATTRAWQIRQAADDDSFVLDPASVGALLGSLSRTLVGLPPGPAGTSLIMDEIPGDPGTQPPSAGQRCIEIIGLITGAPGDARLQCLASKTLVHDEFWDIVTSGITRI
jgi:hypothetical protein